MGKNTRYEERDGQLFTVTVLPDQKPPKPGNRPKRKKGRPSTFSCFACRRAHPWRMIRGSGYTKKGGRWFLCKECAAKGRSAKAVESSR